MLERGDFMGDARSRERRLLKEALSPSQSCVTLIELDGLADGSLTGSASRRVRSHLGGCPRCQMELALLQQFERASPRAGEEADARWITGQLEQKFAGALSARQAERLKPEGSRRSFWPALRPLQAGGLAIAAVLLVAAVGIALRDSRPPEMSTAVSERQVFRSGEVSVLEPAENPAEAPSKLRWAPWAAADSYSVRVMEVDRKELWSAETRQTAVALPAAVRAQIVPRKPLLWEVVARDADGRTLASSGIHTFVVVNQPKG
jgi:putative zinc finger protein